MDTFGLTVRRSFGGQRFAATKLSCQLTSKVLPDQPGRFLPQQRRSSLDGRPVAVHHLLFGDTVLRPCSPAGQRVQQERLQPIQGLSEAGSRRRGLLELVSECQQFASLFRREQTENPFGRLPLRLLKCCLILACHMDRSITRVYFHDIMEQQQLHRVQGINTGNGVSQHQVKHRQVP